MPNDIRRYFMRMAAARGRRLAATTLASMARRRLAMNAFRSMPRYGARNIPRPYKNKYKRRIMNIVHNAAETREKHQAQLIAGIRTFKHDILYSMTLATTNPVDTTAITYIGGGTTESTRAGTDILVKGFRVSGQFGVPWDRRGTTIKCWLVEWNSNQGSLTSADFFRGVTGNDLIDPINTDKFKAKKLGTYRLKSRDLASNTGTNTINYNWWIPFKRRLRYNTNSQAQPVQGMKENLSIVMLAYEAQTTTQLDDVVIAHDQRVSMYWKDM